MGLFDDIDFEDDDEIDDGEIRVQLPPDEEAILHRRWRF